MAHESSAVHESMGGTLCLGGISCPPAWFLQPCTGGLGGAWHSVKEQVGTPLCGHALLYSFFFFFSFIEFTDSSFAYNIQCSSHHMPSFMPITQPLCPQALPSSNPVGFPQLKVSYGLSPSLISSYLYSAFLTPWFFLVVLRNGCSVCPTFIYSSFWAALMSLGRIVQPRLLGKEIAFHEMYAI